MKDETFFIPFSTLIQHENKRIRIYILKVIGKLLEKTNDKIIENNLDLCIEYYLEHFEFDEETYTTILEIMTNNISLNILNTLNYKNKKLNFFFLFKILFKFI